MPTVPVYDTPRVTPDALPGVRQSAPGNLQSGAMVGFEQGRQLGQGAQALATGYQAYDQRVQIEANEAAAKDYDAQLIGGVNGIAHEYRQLNGKTAVDARADTIKKLDDLAAQQTSSVTNPAVQRMVKHLTDMRVQAAKQQVLDHSAQQAEVYQKAAGATRVAVAQDAATLAYNAITDTGAPKYDPEGSNSPYQQYLQTVRSETRDQLQRAGITDSDLVAAAEKNALGKVYVGVLAQMIDGKSTDPSRMAAARKYYAEVKDGLSADQQDKIKTVLEAVDQQTNIVTATRALMAQPGDFKKKFDALGSAFDKGSQVAGVRIDGTTYAHVKSALEHEQQKAKHAADQSEATMLGQAQDWILHNPGKGVMDLPPAIYAGLKAKGHLATIDAFARRGEKDIDDAQAYVDLMNANPRELSQTDLAKARGLLTPAHWNHLVERQSSINKGDLQAAEVDKATKGAIGTAREQIQAAGVDFAAKPGTDKAKAAAQFETTVRDAIAVASPTWLEKKLSPEQMRTEADKIVRGLLKDQALSNTGIAGFFQTKRKPFEMTPEERAAKWTISQADRAEIEKKLQAGGIPPTEDNIQRYYKLSQGVQK